ncbi:rhodanese-related sulfurtransferase, partial [Fischerella thermalis WC559]
TRLDPDAETLVLCHHGIRSAQMCQWLVNQGFTNVKNISGGIDAYSMLVDPSIPVY